MFLGEADYCFNAFIKYKLIKFSWQHSQMSGKVLLLKSFLAQECTSSLLPPKKHRTHFMLSVESPIMRKGLPLTMSGNLQ